MRLAGLATIACLITSAAYASDCEVVADGGLGSMECWHSWPFPISTAELAFNGYELISTSTIEATSQSEREQGQTAHYEISYWRGESIIFQCRSLFRNDGQRLQMTSSMCRSTQAPPDVENLWGYIRRNAPER